MQNALFLHMFLTAQERFPKHKSIFMRTELFSLKPDIDCKAHRIELCRHFSQNRYSDSFECFTVKNERFGMKMWEQYPYCILNYFGHINQTHHERVSTKVHDTSRTCCELTVVSAALLPDRIRSRPTADRTHRQPKCLAALAHSHCLRRFYHARTVAECKYPFPTFIAYFTSALCETRDVIARLSRRRASLGWYGSPPHHRKQRNS